MLFLATLSTLLTAALAAPAPAPALAERQGGAFVAVGIKYATGGCSGTNGVGDPIFGNGNACQPINRFSDEPPVVSYNATSVCSGGSVTLYTGTACTGTAYFAAGQGKLFGCVQGNSPFQSVFVTCPNL